MSDNRFWQSFDSGCIPGVMFLHVRRHPSADTRPRCKQFFLQHNGRTIYASRDTASVGILFGFPSPVAPAQFFRADRRIAEDYKFIS